MTVRIICGDALENLRELADGSVNCLVTSPPYWGLRDYGVDGQLGLEATPGELVDKLVGVFREARRVLRRDGTLWLNAGDTYIGGRSGGKGASSFTSDRNHKASRDAWLASKNGTHRTAPGLKTKDMVGFPWRLAFALQSDGWWLRSEIIWHKRNPMPESVRDRPTRAHEQVFLFAASPKYYYDEDAIAEPVSGGAKPRGHGINAKVRRDAERAFNRKRSTAAGSRPNAHFSSAVNGPVETRRKRSVWSLGSEGFDRDHFATFPTKLVEPCILAGCPVGGTVLDPFGGAGTTGLVADRLGRNAVLIELNPEYCEMARRRIHDDAPLLSLIGGANALNAEGADGE